MIGNPPFELPEGWNVCRISEVAAVNPKVNKKEISDDLLVSFVPMPAVGAEDGSIDVSEQRPFAEVKKGYTGFAEGDVLFAKITPCMENGKMAVVPPVANGYGFGSTEFHVLRPNDEIDAKYLYYYVSSKQFRGEAERHMSGAVGQRRVPTPYLKNCLIPVAPPEQQKRIVAEIEKQFSRLDEAVANLKRVKANLKRYKAAVLKAAVTGELTKEWRAKHASKLDAQGGANAAGGRKPGAATEEWCQAHPDVESASKLLDRILAERRAKWEEAELAKMAAKGKAPKNDKWKAKYKEPVKPDTTNLPELPEGWVWATLGTVLSGIEAGKSFKCEERPPREGEVGVVKVSAVTWGEFDEAESKTCLNDSLISENLFIRTGDFLFSRANTIELVGACVIAKEVNRNVMLSDKILRFELLGGFDEWTLYMLRSMHGRAEIERLATGNQESMRNIGQERIRAIRIPLPPITERDFAVTEVDRHLSLIRETEAQVDTNLQRAERLRQSILAQAFSGHLSGACIKSLEPEEPWPMVAEPGAPYGSVTTGTTRN